MVDVGMLGKEAVEMAVDFALFERLRQLEVDDADGGKVVGHILAESLLAQGLLIAGRLAVLGLLHEHDFGFAISDEHEDARGKRPTADGVLSEERKGLELRIIRVEQDEGNVALVQHVGVGLGELQF